MNIHSTLEKLFHKELYQIAQSFNYSKENVYILQNNFTSLKQDFPEVWNSIESCVHERDMRSAEEYAKDLVSSWVYEDSVFRYLSKFFDISLEGGDKHRKILDHSKVSSTSDYVIKSEGQEVAIELINSYTNYWKKSQRIDLRDNKFTKLRNDKSILLCVDLFNKEFYVVDLNDKNLKHEYTPFHKPYGKPAYQIDISDISIHELTMPKMKDILNEIVTEER